MNGKIHAGWHAVPGPQQRFLSSPHCESALAGGRGSMRSESLLGLMISGHVVDSQGNIKVPPRWQRPNFRAMYFSPTEDEMRELRKRSLEIWAHAGAYLDKTIVRFAEPNTSYVSFSHAPDKAKPFAVVGSFLPVATRRPLDLVCFDDLQEFDEAFYRQFVRSAAEQALEKKVRVRVTFHPDGPYRAWIKARWARWLDESHDAPLKDGESYIAEDFTVAARTRQLIRTSIDDCPFYANSPFAESIKELTDPVKRARLYLGNWNVEEDVSTHEIEDVYSIAAMAKYRDDPIGFVTRFLRVRDENGVLVPMRLWKKQRQVLEALAKGKKRVVVRSGHKIGKTMTLAAAALWWAFTRPRAKVIVTSSTGRQVSKQVWAEIQNVARMSELKFPCGQELPGPTTGVTWDDGRLMLGFSTDQPPNMGGWSSPDLLFIADEASGVPTQIFEAVEGNMIGGGALLMCGNPTEQSGYFFDTFHDAGKMEVFERIAISSEETPNCTGEEPPIPGLATREGIEFLAKSYGRDSAAFAVRVTGDFPKNTNDCIISLGMVEAAKKRYLEFAENEVDIKETLSMGVDVARYGDDKSCVTSRRGLVIFKRERHKNTSIPELAMLVFKSVLAQRQGDEVVRVKVDVIGIGAGVADMLRQWEFKDIKDESGRIVRNERIMHVIDVHSGSASDDIDADTGIPRFPNLRSEMWFNLRQAHLDGAAYAPDSMFEGELLAPIYKINSRGQQEVESKDDTKKKIKRSPDDADSAMLAFYEPVVEEGIVGEGGPIGEAFDRTPILAY